MSAPLGRALFTSQRQTWRTPRALYEALDAEFGFTLDPCTVEQTEYDGLLASWEGQCVFVNPPYKSVAEWVAKCYTSAPLTWAIVALVPSRTDTAWWHDYAMKADEIRFIRGRLRFDEHENSAPFPSAILIWRGAEQEQKP